MEVYMKKRSKVSAVLLSLALLICALPTTVVKADSTGNSDDTSVEVSPYISLGADLNAQQKDIVLALLGVTEADLDNYEVLQVTNKDEHEYLDDYLSASVIGTKALSSVRIEKGEEGKGIHVETKNITYCTSGMYTNALITAGITDADVIVAGPFELSGTAALVGAMKAYEAMTGETLSDDREDAATNELVLTSELAQSIGSDDAEKLMALVKEKVANGDIKDADDLQKAIEESADELGVSLTDAQKQKLAQLFDKISKLDLDVDKLKQQAESIYNKLQDLGLTVDEAQGWLDKIVSFFKKIAETVSSWF